MSKIEFFFKFNGLRPLFFIFFFFDEDVPHWRIISASAVALDLRQFGKTNPQSILFLKKDRSWIEKTQPFSSKSRDWKKNSPVATCSTSISPRNAARKEEKNMDSVR